MNALTKTENQVDYILLDCSSSMCGKWFECLSAIDAYVDGLARENISSDTILHMFYSQNPDYIHRECNNRSWVPLSHECPEPWGGTPLYDAVILMGQRLRALDPPRASIVIVTDGDNNEGASDVHAARRVLDWIKAKGWQVTFIGADFRNSEVAGLLGVGEGSAIGVQKRLLSDAARNLASKRGNYGRTGADMHFSEGERQQFGGYLNAPAPK